MKSIFTVVFFLVFALSSSLGAKELSPLDQHLALHASAKILHVLHFEHPPMDDRLSPSIFKTYMQSIDPQRIYFLKSDFDEFQNRYAENFYFAIVVGNPAPATAIFDRFRVRVGETRAAAHEILQNQASSLGANTSSLTEFNQNETLTLPFKTWAATEQDRQSRIRALIRENLLSAKILNKNLEEEKTLIGKRFDRIAQDVQATDSGTVIANELAALMHRYDPHSDYFGPSESEDFAIHMNMAKLIGIGAHLQEVDGYAIVADLIPGGPAAKDGRLKPGDKIIAIAQADGSPVDVVEMKLSKIVQLIRGAENSTVKLSIIPKANPKERASIELTRKTIDLTDAEAKAKLIQLAGSQDLIGVITLNAFYENCARDVEKLLGNLKTQGVSAITLDLRGNGGGLLGEAVKLVGLFIKTGPVTSARIHTDKEDSQKKVYEDNDPKIVYGGPLVVLVDQLSASASEIVSAALQDYHRALVIGGVTHGKGTIQSVINIRQALGTENDVGSIHVTMGEFFRVTGKTTQFDGVTPDILLPSYMDGMKTEERYSNYALQPRQVEAETFTPFEMGILPLEKLRKASSTRVASNPEFAYLQTLKTKRLKESQDEINISLSETVRRQEMAEQEANKKKHLDELRNQEPSLKIVKEFSLHGLESSAGRSFDEKTDFEFALEAQLVESMHIISDWLGERKASENLASMTDHQR